jgi:hypothetical protein
MENANSVAPTTKLFAVWLRDGRKNPHRVGVIRLLWAMSDNTPAAKRITFLYDNLAMLWKRIAQKGLFFYHPYYMTKR